METRAPRRLTPKTERVVTSKVFYSADGKTLLSTSPRLTTFLALNANPELVPEDATDTYARRVAGDNR